MANGNGKNRWLGYSSVALAAIVSLIVIYRAFASSAAQTALTCDKVDRLGVQTTDHETRLRKVEDAYREMRPVMRAVARRLNVEIDEHRHDEEPDPP